MRCAQPRGWRGWTSFFHRLPLRAGLVSILLLSGGCGGSSTNTIVQPPAEPPPAAPQEPPVETPREHTVLLPAGHGLANWLTDHPGGVVTVAAGGTVDAGGVRFTCPGSGGACRVAVTLEDGAVRAVSTGGMATASLAPAAPQPPAQEPPPAEPPTQQPDPPLQPPSGGGGGGGGRPPVTGRPGRINLIGTLGLTEKELGTTYYVSPGTYIIAGKVRVTCPPGGSACNHIRFHSGNPYYLTWEGRRPEYRVLPPYSLSAAVFDAYAPTAASDPPAAVSDLMVGYDYNADPRTTITLSDSGGAALDPVSVTAPVSGWTARRFSLADDTGQGVVITNRGRGQTATTERWTEYFPTGFEHAISLDTATGELSFPSGAPGPSRQVDKYGSFIRVASDFSFEFTISGTTYNSLSELTVGTQFQIPNGSYTGSYRGVSGTFTVSNARLTRNSDDTFAYVGPPYPIKFLPDDYSASLSFQRIPGATRYLTLGYWLATDSQDVATMIDTFAREDSHGPAYTGSSSEQRPRGLARYSGAAAGVYVLKDGDTITANGEFVANVDLTAHFRIHNTTVGGRVHNFRSTTSSQDQDTLRTWSLDLQSPPGFNHVVTGSRTHAGKTSGGAGATEGDWNARFFGKDTNIRQNTPAGELPAPGVHPTAVVGAFTGHFPNGSVAGAYAADKTYSCDPCTNE